MKRMSSNERERSPRYETRPPAESARDNLIYGTLPVKERLRAGARHVEKILIAEGANEQRIADIIRLARENHIPFQHVPRAQFAALLGADVNHQGVAAIVAAAGYYDAGRLVEEIAVKENSLSLVLDGVEDPRNLGAIVRTAECAGVDGIFIPERRAAGLTDTVAKTSAGAVEYVKIAKAANLNRLIEELKSKNIWTIGTTSDADLSYTEWDWRQSSALVMGSEGKGLHRLVAEKCDVLVKIPLLGKIDSLNVSVAAGVVLYEALRQRSL
jgi:23S rRNA (guanosine2251-2'-O)-methyltransferase